MKQILRNIMIASIFICFIIIGSIAGVFISYYRYLPDVGKISDYYPLQTTKIYSDNNELIANIFTEDRVVIPISEIPDNFKFAIMAVEDSRFYEHRGIDPIGIIRALHTNIKSGRIVQGGSTITQQLARSLFLSRERTIFRKILEMLLALKIEEKYSKDEILEMYLNQIYFGEGAYGVEAAAQVYFGKSAKELNLAECALLAGLPRSPVNYSPYANYKLAKERQAIVLNKMYEFGFINEEELEKAINTKLEFKKPTARIIKHAPYFVMYTLKLLEEEIGKETIYNAGLKVYTTLSLSMQKAAEEAIDKWLKIAKKEKLNINQAALIAMEVKTGYIKALVGGVNFKESQYNRAVQARRQPGSAFKPFVYVVALMNGYTPSSIINDSPITFSSGDGKKWSPHNYDKRFRGPVTLRYALQWSINVPAVKVAYDIGPETIVEYARLLGLESVDELKDSTCAVALGGLTYGVSPLEMARAYSVFANDGIKCSPIAIQKVTYSDGRILYESRIKRIAVIEPDIARTMTQLLNLVMRSGTGRRAYIGGACAGKTGTTSDFRDAWFIGYTPDLCVAVWVGNDNNTPTKRVCGGYIPAAIWKEFMQKILKGSLQGEFKPPTEKLLPKKEKVKESVQKDKEYVEVEICAESGKLATPYCPNIILQRFSPDDIPEEKCDIHIKEEDTTEETSREEIIEIDICKITGKLANEYCPEIIQRKLPKSKIPKEVCDFHGPSY